MSASTESSGAQPAPGTPPGAAKLRTDRRRALLSRLALILAIAVLCGTFFLMSPRHGETYPGAIPWRELSLLRPLIDLMSLGGLVATARGTEIKDLVLHAGAALGLLLLAARLWLVPPDRLSLRRLAEPWLAAQILLTAWVLLSALSSLWSVEPAAARGQAALYALLLAWAGVLAWTLEREDARRAGIALVIVSSVAGALCVWYYYERNNAHRPGFPIGNPGTLAAALVPAILLSALELIRGTVRWRLARRFEFSWSVAGAALTLVPLLWCFALTNSRSAAIGLAVGLAAVALCQGGWRWRAAVAGGVLLGAIAVALWLGHYSRLDAAMARSATIRFRLYAWRYSAELWDQSWLSSVAGQGAGAYPWLAGQFSVNDRALDPAAFMAELVEHAHNELFEVLTEIGLVGGVTFVGGWLATIVAGTALVRGSVRRERRWLYLGLLAGLAGLMSDSMCSPALRLSGVPAVFYTLLGLIWAASRAAMRPAAADTLATLVDESARPGHRRPVTVAAAAAAVVLAVGAGWLTLRDWSGVRSEVTGLVALDEGAYPRAVGAFERAEARLLDPVRCLISDGLSLRAQLGAARDAHLAFLSAQASTTSQPTTQESASLAELWSAAVARCRQVYADAVLLGQRAPTMMQVETMRATAAEMLANLLAADRAPDAKEWSERAEYAWHVQRRFRPYDVETLLSLIRYPASMAYQVSLLRDALRSPESRDRWGYAMTFDEVRQRWLGALRQLAPQAGFADTLDQFLAAVGPVSPETDLDSLIASRAPETHRLKAHFDALRGDYRAAEDLAARAAALYAPLRARFPTLQSVALLEQAEFTLRESPARAPAAVVLLRTAVELLPRIQAQKVEALARPFRSWLAVALLAAEDEPAATDVIRSVVADDALVSPALADCYIALTTLYIRRPPDERPPVEPWLAAAIRLQPGQLGAWMWTAWLAAQRGDEAAIKTDLAKAARAGVQPADLERIRQGLCQEFPAVCVELGIKREQ